MTKKSSVIVIEKEVTRSKAFRSLKLSASVIVYHDFLAKRVMSKQKGKPGKRGWVIENNGRIEYSYSEALRNGISKPRFARAISELVEVGLIDIAHSGGGYDGDKSLYAISHRWRKFGTKEFEKQTRPKDTRLSRHFKAYHKKMKEKSHKLIELRPKLIRRKKP